MPEAQPTNTVHFACFACRSAFKQPGSSNWDPEVPQRPFVCPNCKTPMVRLGRYFKAPPKRAIKQWLKLELLYSFGERFSAGYTGLGQSCDTLAATVAYLIDLGHAKSDVRSRLQHIRGMRQP
ncbi:MAG: hypothetical protein AAFY26_10375 [Cyanobacteria bacterium J06638_22]